MCRRFRCGLLLRGLRYRETLELLAELFELLCHIEQLAPELNRLVLAHLRVLLSGLELFLESLNFGVLRIGLQRTGKRTKRAGETRQGPESAGQRQDEKRHV